MNLVITWLASFIAGLLMIIGSMVMYFGDKGLTLLEEFISVTSENKRNIDINGIRLNQHDIHFIRIDDDVDELEAEVKQLTK